MKAEGINDHEAIRLQPSAFRAKRMGREITLRSGWGNSYGDLCWYVMMETVLAKAIQQPEVAEALIETEDARIYEDAPSDNIWGWRKANNYNGKNLLGLAWMQARDILFGGQ
jgi:predicted NAD-dependent protein-ADP-ribosyltransferase YbiA (DUF1768 family)